MCVTTMVYGFSTGKRTAKNMPFRRCREAPAAKSLINKPPMTVISVTMFPEITTLPHSQDSSIL